MLRVLFTLVAILYSANSQSAVTLFLSAGSSATTALTCASQCVTTSLQLFANSSVQYVTYIPDYGSACITTGNNFTAIQALTTAPNIITLLNGKAFIPSTSYCITFINPFSVYLQAVYLLTVTCQPTSSLCFMMQPETMQVTTETPIVSRGEVVVSPEIKLNFPTKEGKGLPKPEMKVQVKVETQSKSDAANVIPSIILFVIVSFASLINM